MTPPSHPHWSRWVLRLLPSAFRERFGAEFEESCQRLSTDARRHGGLLHQVRYIVREWFAAVRLAWSLRKLSHQPAAPAMGGHRMFERLWLDLRWAVRHGVRRPIPSAAMVMTIALAMAVATTSFALAGAVLWRELPFTASDRLVFLWEEVPRDGQPTPSRATAAAFQAWTQAAGGDANLALFGAAGFTLETPAGATTVQGVRVSSNYFEVLGIRPLAGRTFSPEEDTPGRHRVVVLSSGMWHQRFGGRDDVVGQDVVLSGQAYTIIGIMPPGTYPGWPLNPATVKLDDDTREFWVPIQRTPALLQSARAHVFGVLARVSGGGDPTALAEKLRSAGRTSNGADPHQVRAERFRQHFVAEARTPLVTLALSALALLALACANLAAVQASAFETRRAELALRAAIGAGASQLARQVVLELVVLVAAGTLIGTLIARAVVAELPRLLPSSVPFLAVPGLDAQAVLFAGCLGLLATLFISGWPLLRLVLSPPSPRGVLRGRRPAVYRVLVVSQLAIAVAMTSAAALLGRSLQLVESQPPGFNRTRLLVADIGLRQRPAADVALSMTDEQRMLEAIAGVNGIHAAAFAYDHPLAANWSENPTVSGDPATENQRLPVDLRIVSSGYVEALGVELLDGRTLTMQDAIGMPGVALVNEAFARQLGGRVLGRRIRTSTPSAMFSGAPTEFEIVGVVTNERSHGLERPAQPAYYLSTRQFPQSNLRLLVRTASEDPLARVDDIRAAVRRIDSAVTVDRVTTIDRILGEQLVARRVTSAAIGGFAVTALALAALGVYGLLMMTVSSSRRDIGVRLAIGASPQSIARRIIADGLVNAAVGLSVGIVLALIAGRYLAGMLVGVSPTDPLLLAVTVVCLFGVALLATALPAWRAARVDPLVALRQD